jgi:hypothetical protein
MHSQEAFFARAHCRIDIDIRPGVGEPRYVATVSMIDDASEQLHPLVFRSGSRLSFPASSEAGALTSTLTYLEKRFGAFSEIMHGCLIPARMATIGDPVVVEEM